MFLVKRRKMAACATAFLALTGLAYYKYQNDIHVQRNFFFWKKAFPIFVRYKIKELKVLYINIY